MYLSKETLEHLEKIKQQSREIFQLRKELYNVMGEDIKKQLGKRLCDVQGEERDEKL